MIGYSSGGFAHGQDNVTVDKLFFASKFCFMVHIGIDIGTDSVRVCAVSIHAPRTLEEPLTRAIDGPCHTMDGEKLWKTISDMVERACQEAEGDEAREREENEVQEREEIEDVEQDATRGGVAARSFFGSEISVDNRIDAEAGKNEEFGDSIPHPMNTRLRPTDKFVTEKSSKIPETSSGESSQEANLKSSYKSYQSNPSTSGQYPLSSSSSICVAATCSMVVMQRIAIENTCYYRALIPGQEVFVWMDSRAQQEAQQLSRLLPQFALAQVGGTVTPEMGLAKMMWINSRYDDVVVFELYDWISYLFVAGGIRDGLVKCLDGDLVSFGAGLTAMDGSVKGWSDELMTALGLKVRVGHVPSAGIAKVKTDAKENVKTVANGANVDTNVEGITLVGSGFEYVGTPLNVCYPGPLYGGFSVCHGCIDCYGGWAGMQGEPREEQVNRGEINKEARKDEFTEEISHEFSVETKTIGTIDKSSPSLATGLSHGSISSSICPTSNFDTVGSNEKSTMSIDNSTASHSTSATHGAVDGESKMGAKSDCGQLRTSVSTSQAAKTPTYSPSSLYMVAGTLTCFIADIVASNPLPISGLWGHFDQLAPRAVYSFGQPATGLLFGELFGTYRSLIGHHDPFKFVEARASEIEASFGVLLTVLTRQYLYYGDRHGNRSPYGDFSMGEILVDGSNAGNSSSDKLLTCSMTEMSVESLVVKYYLTLEYLVFQTCQLATMLQNATSPLGQVTVCGSQAHNQRFIQMLAQFVFSDANLMVGSSAKYAGAQGVAVAAAKLMEREEYLQLLQAPALRTEPLVIEQLDRRDISILKTKYEYWHQLAQWQANFRTAMATV